MKYILSIALLTITSFLCSFSQTYYVSSTGSDAAAGTQAEPWASIQYAVDQAQAGDTIKVKKGQYSGQVSITQSGNSNQFIHLLAIDSVKLAGENDAAFLIQGDYWKIEGFDISRYGGDEVGVIDIKADHIYLKNMEVHDIPGKGILIGPASDIQIESSKIYDCLAGIFLDSTVNNLRVKNVELFASQTLLCQEGDPSEPSMTFALINDWKPSGSSNWLFENVSIRGVGWYGVDFRSRTPNFPEINPITNVTFRNCNFFQNGNRYTAGGGWPWYDFPPEYYYGNALFQGMDTMLVENCRFEDGGDWGIDFYKCSHILVRNNLFLHNGSRTPITDIGDGLEVNGGVDNRIFNNLFYGNATAGLFLSYIIESTDEYHSATSLVANNIMWNNGADLAIVGPSQEEPLDGKYFSTNTLYNNIYVSEDKFGPLTSIDDLVGSSNYPRFADTSAGNYSLLSGSPAIDAGWKGNTMVPNTDFNGALRSIPVDIGPYEFGTITDIQKIDSETMILYPVPTSDIIFVKGTKVGSLIQIVNIQGRVMLQMESDSQEVKIDLANLPTGVYTLMQIDPKGVFTNRKFLIKR